MSSKHKFKLVGIGHDRGFTIVETLISLAIISVVVIGASAALKMNSKASLTIAQSTKFKDFEPAIASLLLKRTKEIIMTAASSASACNYFSLDSIRDWYGNSSSGYTYSDPPVTLSLRDNPNQFTGFSDDLKRRCLNISVTAEGEEGPAQIPETNLCNVQRFYGCFEITTQVPSSEEIRKPYYSMEIVTAANTNPNSFFAKNRAIVEIRFDLKNLENNTDATFSQFGAQTNKGFKLYYSMNWTEKDSTESSPTNRNSAMLTGYVLNEIPETNPTSNQPPDDGKTNCMDGAFPGGGTVPNHYCLFASKDGYYGNLGGLQGADDLCIKMAAEGNMLHPGITWKAILSDSSTDAKDRIRVDRAIYSTHMTNGTTFSGYLIAYANQFWTSRTGAPFVYNQFGIYDQYKEPETYHGNHTWTATNPDGTHTDTNCYNWKSTSGHGHVGDAGDAGDVWRDGGKDTQPCNHRHQLYCISQPK